MQFNTAEYLIFLPLVLFTYFALPHRWRRILLLIVSYYFYMAWKVEYVLLLFVSTLINYHLALQIEQRQSVGRQRALLFVSLSVNLGLLFTFKYFNFFGAAVNDLLAYFNIFYHIPAFQLLLPVGISFYTFQTLSYTIDVYRGVEKAERSFVLFALYVSFFPQLVAGPIERANRLLPQFAIRHDFEYARVTSGLRRLAWGMFKKIVIADKAALIVNAIYQHPQGHSGTMLLFATYLFAFQIYCDFSGYSDIAIGTARMLGISLMENFRQPYLSASIGDFWHRWHISLSTWFRDYLYIPLGGNRVSEVRRYLNLLIVFIVSGLWHGANWTFVIWGFLHGLYIVGEQLLQRPAARLAARFGLPAFSRWPTVSHLLRAVLVFHLVVFAWIFFRAESVGDAFYIVRQIFTGLQPTLRSEQIHIGLTTLIVLCSSIVLMELVELLRRANRLQLTVQPAWVRWSSYYALVVLIVLFGELQAKGQFIYFQF